MPGRPLCVGGFTPFTASDYPGQLAATVFVQGCAWRCGYCHNPHLQPRTAPGPLAWQALAGVLERRRGLLDAVVFSGGEPTTDAALPDAMDEVRAMGFKVGLHTACLYPARLHAVLGRVDWVGFDVKAPFGAYATVTGVPGSGAPARACVAAIVGSGIDSECRTTVHPALLGPDALLAMADELAALGVHRWVLQQFRAQGCADAALRQGAAAAHPEWTHSGAAHRGVAGVAGVAYSGAAYPDDSLLAALRGRIGDVVWRRA